MTAAGDGGHDPVYPLRRNSCAFALEPDTAMGRQAVTHADTDASEPPDEEALWRAVLADPAAAAHCPRLSVSRPWALYGPILAADRPFVVAQLGQSLDGRVATVDGASQYINGSAALDHLHRLRASVDAVLVGVGTVLSDDPQLTVRRCFGANPVRVVVDARARLPSDARCLSGEAPLIVVRGPDGLTADIGETIRVPRRADGLLDPVAIVAALVARGLRRILVEGGATTVSHFLEAGAVDRLHVAVAPLLIGSGIAGLKLAPVASLDAAMRPPTAVYVLDDGNVLFDCDIAAARPRTGRLQDDTADDLSAAGADAALDDRDLRPRRDPPRHRHGAGAVGADAEHAL